MLRHPAREGRHLEAILKAEQIGGLGSEMRSRKASGGRHRVIPDVVWCGARGCGSQPRTRAAAGLRPAGHYEPPARSWLTTGIAGESAARRRDKNAAVERRKASIPRRHLRRLRKLSAAQGMRRRKAEVGAPFGAPLPSLSRGRNEEAGEPGAFQTIRVAERWLCFTMRDISEN